MGIGAAWDSFYVDIMYTLGLLTTNVLFLGGSES